MRDGSVCDSALENDATNVRITKSYREDRRRTPMPIYTLEFAGKHIQSLSSSDSFPEIDVATARAWSADPERTTYLLDVRTPEEFESGHLDGTLSSEGGQLLGVRARTVAHWLQRRGYEIAILLVDFQNGRLSDVA